MSNAMAVPGGAGTSPTHSTATPPSVPTPPSVTTSVPPPPPEPDPPHATQNASNQPTQRMPVPPSGGNGVHRLRWGLDHAHQRDVVAFTDRQIEERRQNVRGLLPPLLLELQQPAPTQLGADGIHDLQRSRRIGQPKPDHPAQLLLVHRAKGGAEHRVDGVVD